ncbi:997f33c9-20b8-47c1-9e75-7ffa2b48a494 [Sclerotinia trifoliorum]|uniref:997f33c9-20b8-47c1-9e75-7ffa2b48a494 n=1 Tax=Sclerotinia trifoliorum TaxID=28548 RepID=A0A8H2VVH9_9HELO|nr:997f33c9-20b8-47c1-9e75-7ffa2b48a494 [Sclerotinia trifoliorum]
MYLSFSLLLFATRGFSSPTFRKRVVTSLDQAAFEEAQQRDDTATRAFSSVPIITSSGQCLFVDGLSGDFRANLTPVQVTACDGSTGQLWDVLTSGKHNDVAGSMLVVNTLTQACLNFDPRRAAGNTVIMFSCGGRADGDGVVTNSQLFPFNGTSGPLTLSPENAPGTCLSATTSNVLDEAPCDETDSSQTFTFGASNTSIGPAAASSVAPAVSATSAASDVAAIPTSTVLVTPAVTSSLSSPSSVAVTAAASTVPTGDPTAPLPVSRAGGVLDPSAAAEANALDNTAVKAFSSVALKDASGQCLFVDPTAGDFRQNLIPITLQACDGSQNQAWDIVTSGKHNNVVNSVLVVSSLTQGCLNFDPRRPAGDTVIMFSCGGRADGDGLVTNSQLFPFIEKGQTSILLAPENGNNATCLAANAAGKLDSTTCSGDKASQSFTIVTTD